MLKRIISLFLLLLITGCGKKEGIGANLYINSMGFDYKDEYIVYMYSSSSFDNVLNEMQIDDTNPQIGVARGKGIAECIMQLETSMYERINYEHISTVLLSKDFVDKERIEEVVLFFGNRHQFSVDFYFYVTENIEEAYSVISMDKASADNSLFLNPELNTSLFKNANYVTVAASIYEKYRGIKIPVLTIKEDIWSSGESKKVLVIEGIMYYCDGQKDYFDDEFLPYGSEFKTNKIKIDSLLVSIRDYKLNLRLHDDSVKLCANANIVIVINENNLTDMEIIEIVKEEINKQLQQLVELNKKVDILNVRDYLYRRGYDINNQKYNIDINIRK